jgi:Flp pilus assembly pilin Flp
MFSKLWNDESGVIALEYLFLVTIVGLGLAVGYSNLEAAYNMEYTELANAVMALNQGYAIAGQSGCFGSKAGSNATDTAFTFGLSGNTVTANTINVTFCVSPGLTTTP